jgi:small subunit ribosomal protein S5e
MAEVEAEEAYVEPAYEEEAVEPEEEEYAVQGVATEVKLFGKWAFGDIEVRDISLVVRFYPLLFVVSFSQIESVIPSFTHHMHCHVRYQDYIACKGDHATYLPHTAGRYAKKRFRKASCPIVERLVCCLMRKGRNTGKKLMAVRIVQHALEIIHLLTDQNPIQVVVDAIINSGPREDSTRVGGAGVVRRQAVDMSPFRRVNYALYLIATGAREASFRNLKTMAECLAEELINAARGSSNSYAIKKKDEIERVSKSNR